MSTNMIPLGIKGFRGSDWDNAGERLFVVKDKAIWVSSDRGATFQPWPAWQPSNCPDDGYGYYGFPILLMIPSRIADEPERMLVSPLGSQRLFECADINAADPQFVAADLPGIDVRTQDAGVFNGFAEDAQGTLYVGWYSIFVPSVNDEAPMAVLFRKRRDDASWTQIKTWSARHIHAVRVNPYNSWLYVVLGEPYNNNQGTDPAKVFRSKDGGQTWTCVTDTWGIKRIGDVGLYFATIGFIRDRVILGEDTDWERGRIYQFIDYDSDAGPPFVTVQSYETAHPAEFFLGATSMGDKLYFASQFMSKIGPRRPDGGYDYPATTRCISTRDGLEWKKEIETDSDGHNLGILTYHPERGNKLVISLSGGESNQSGYAIDMAAPIMFYNSTSQPSAQPWASAILDASGNCTDAQSGTFAPPSPWTDIVVARSRGVLFYCASTENAYTGSLGEDGSYTPAGPLRPIGSWTHVVTAARGWLFFYNASEGYYRTVHLDSNGNLGTWCEQKTCWKKWTHVVGTANGDMLFYRTDDAVAATGYVDSNGNYCDVGLESRIIAGWDHIVASGKGGLFFYRKADGMWSTALLDPGSHGFVCTASGFGFSRTWTHLLGTSQGALLFYNSQNGNLFAAHLTDAGRYIDCGHNTTTVNSGWTNVSGS
jgi:hypothetical protein